MRVESHEGTVRIHIPVVRSSEDSEETWKDPVTGVMQPEQAIAMAHSLLLAAWSAEHGEQPNQEQVRQVMRWAL